MAFDPKQQRQIMGLFATGVTVVSTRAGDVEWGMTANAVTSLSLNPPLVLVAIDRGAQSHAYFKDGGCFAVNILTAQQEEVSTRFAMPGPKDFSGLETRTAETGAPILVDALGWVDCRLHEILPGGDHDIFVGEVVAGAAAEGAPLLFYQGKYAQLAE